MRKIIRFGLAAAFGCLATNLPATANALECCLNTMQRKFRSRSPIALYRPFMRSLLATSALVPLGLMAVAPTPAIAACAVTGTGTITMLESGDNVNCLGLNINQLVRDSGAGSSNIIVNIGDGSTPTSLTPGVGTPAIFMTDAPGLHLTVTNQAAIIGSAGNWGVLLSGNGTTDNAIISVNSGGSISADTNNSAIRLSGHVLDAITGFQLLMNGTLTGGTGFSSSSMTNGLIQVGSGGIINAGTGVSLEGSHNNSIVLGAGSLIHHTATSGSGISLTASDNNTITVGGTINSNGISTSGISTSGGATGNLITILSTGYVKASQQEAREFGSMTAATLSTIPARFSPRAKVLSAPPEPIR
jgi:hypothetical protein